MILIIVLVFRVGSGNSVRKTETIKKICLYKFRILPYELDKRCNRGK